MTRMSYPFTQSDAESAIAEWGCNCGPSALAFALQRDLDFARNAIENFEQNRYTSITMMRAALGSIGVEFDEVRKPTKRDMFNDRVALVRLQWSGNWNRTQWASHHTHWIASWIEPFRAGPRSMVFDINGGVRSYEDWQSTIVPLLLPARGDGDWFPTHVLRLRESVGGGSKKDGPACVSAHPAPAESPITSRPQDSPQ